MNFLFALISSSIYFGSVHETCSLSTNKGPSIWKRCRRDLNSRRFGKSKTSVGSANKDSVGGDDSSNNDSREIEEVIRVIKDWLGEDFLKKKKNKEINKKEFILPNLLMLQILERLIRNMLNITQLAFQDEMNARGMDPIEAVRMYFVNKNWGAQYYIQTRSFDYLQVGHEVLILSKFYELVLLLINLELLELEDPDNYNQKKRYELSSDILLKQTETRREASSYLRAIEMAHTFNIKIQSARKGGDTLNYLNFIQNLYDSYQKLDSVTSPKESTSQEHGQTHDSSQDPQDENRLQNLEDQDKPKKKKVYKKRNKDGIQNLEDQDKPKKKKVYKKKDTDGDDSGGGGDNNKGSSIPLPLLDPKDEKDFPVEDRDSEKDFPVEDRDSEKDFPVEDRDSEKDFPVEDRDSEKERFPVDDVEEGDTDSKLSFEKVDPDSIFPVDDVEEGDTDSKLSFEDVDPDSKLPFDDVEDVDPDSKFPVDDVEDVDPDSKLPFEFEDVDPDSKLSFEKGDTDSIFPFEEGDTDSEFPFDGFDDSDDYDDSDDSDNSETEEDLPDQNEYFIQDQKEYFEKTKYFKDQEYKKTKKKGKKKIRKKNLNNKEGTQNQESAQNQDSDLNQESAQNQESDPTLEGTRNSAQNQESDPTLEGTRNSAQNQESDPTLEGTQKYRHLWVQCENCYGLNYQKYFFQTNLNICEHCGFNLKLSSLERIELPVDQGTWNPMDEDMISTDPIEFDGALVKTDPIEFDGALVKTDPIEFDGALVKTDPLQIYGNEAPFKIFIPQEEADSKKNDHICPCKCNEKNCEHNINIYIHCNKETPEHHICPCECNEKNCEHNINIHIHCNKCNKETPEHHICKCNKKTRTAVFEASRNHKDLDKYSRTKSNVDSKEYAHSGIKCEDSKNPIAFNLTNYAYADGIDFESESKEENSKEEGVSEDCIDFGYESEEKDYKDRIDSYQEETGLTEAVQTGTGQLNGIPVAIGVMDFQFIGGSMGSVVGEKITRLIEYATKKGLPLILVCASGGARMQEGSLSLMQMAKISAALHKHQTKKKLFYISILTSPTTGGVTASFGMLGDLIITEPDAEIAFAGKRVIEQTLNLTVPEDLQTSENLFQKGLFDLIIPRNLLKNVLSELLRLHAFVPSAQIVK